MKCSHLLKSISQHGEEFSKGKVLFCYLSPLSALETRMKGQGNIADFFTFNFTDASFPISFHWITELSELIRRDS